MSLPPCDFSEVTNDDAGCFCGPLTVNWNIGRGDLSAVVFALSGGPYPIIPGSFTVTAGNLFPTPFTVSGTDDGAGNITGTHIVSGTVDYDTGDVSITLDTPLDAYTVLSAQAQVNWSVAIGRIPAIVEDRQDGNRIAAEVVGTGDGMQTIFSYILANIPDPGTLSLVLDNPVTGSLIPVFLGDDNSVVGQIWSGEASAGVIGAGVKIGTIDYSTGEIDLDLTAFGAPLSGQRILAYYGSGGKGVFIYPWTNLPGAVNGSGGGAQSTTHSAFNAGFRNILGLTPTDIPDGGTDWIVARGYSLGVPSGSDIKHISFAWKGNLNDPTFCGKVKTYTLGILKGNSIFPYPMGFQTEVAGFTTPSGLPWPGSIGGSDSPGDCSEDEFFCTESQITGAPWLWGKLFSSGLGTNGLNSDPTNPRWYSYDRIAGGSLPSRSYTIFVTLINSQGETLPGSSSSILITANHLLRLWSPLGGFYEDASITGFNIYAADNSLPLGSPFYKQNASPIPLGGSWTEPSSGLLTSGAKVPFQDTSHLTYDVADINGDGFGFAVAAIGDSGYTQNAINLTGSGPTVSGQIQLLPGQTLVPGSLIFVVAYLSGPKRIAYDDGAGNIVGFELTGSIDYTTGIFSLTTTGGVDIDASTTCSFGVYGLVDTPAAVNVKAMQIAVYYVPPAGPPAGHVVVIKVTDPPGSTATFTMTPNTGMPFTMSDGDMHDSGPVSTSTYSLIESSPAGWFPKSSVDLNAIPVTPGDTTTVTITNTYAPEPSPLANRLVVHDFVVGGRGYLYNYSGMKPTIFVRDPSSVVSVKDTNERMRLWATSGHTFNQIEDGSVSDNGSTYTADSIQILNLGVLQPLVAGIEFSGDKNVIISHSRRLDQTLGQLDILTPDTVQDEDDTVARIRADIETGQQFLVVRAQLTSHAGAGDSLDLNLPVQHVPLETYGRIYVSRPDLGVGRKVGGTAP